MGQYTAFRIVTAFIAIAGISMAFLGVAKRRLSLLERILMLGDSIALIPEFRLANLLGLEGIAIALARQGLTMHHGILRRLGVLAAKDRSPGMK